MIGRITLLLLSLAVRPLPTMADEHYGVDISFPIHKSTVSTNYDWLPHNADPEHNPVPEDYRDMPVQPLGDKQKFYNDFIGGCREFYGKRGSLCDSTEYDRIEMNKRQPQSVQNYTDTGFKKIRAPEELYSLLKNHWDRNEKNRKQEKWNAGNTYTNHWAAPTYMVSVEDTALRGAGHGLKKKIWDAARPTLEEWTGQKLSPSSLYGVRIYTEGAVLAPHVDRMPLVSSCIVNVAQDVDEDWPLEVVGRDGRSYNVTMKPGDMVLYESHSTMHARPFPMKGRYFANAFIHFEPVGHGLDGLPIYIREGSSEAERWRRNHPNGRDDGPSQAAVVNLAHTAAQTGDVQTLSQIAAEDRDELHKKDQNGWQPIHEGARGGHKEVVELLIKHGANPNERTNNGAGGTPLWWAKQSLGDAHPVVMLLKSLGALNIGPDL